MVDNINSAADTPPSWDPRDTPASLRNLRNYAERQATRAIQWYYEKKKSKAFWSWYLRFTAVLFSGMGALCPILATVWPIAGALPTSQLGYIFLGTAAMFVGFDRYTGSSSGWMRYIAAVTKLETLLEEFRLRWVGLEADVGDRALNDEDTKGFLDAVESFALAVRAVVEKETHAWIAEFQDNLGELEKETREVRTTLRDRARKAAEGTAAASGRAVLQDSQGPVSADRP